MKLISFVVPSYNSEQYLDKCVESLLVGGDDIEILIIDDGSTDGTAAIADSYEQKYPGIVRAVHKENGGHGSGVNRGLREASGLYYKVVDSDDWLDSDALKTLIATVREHTENGEGADLYITNFVYEHVYDGTSYVSSYTKKMPVGRFFEWKDVAKLRLWKMLLMHSLIYRTEKLRESGLVLPEHTFYVDNIYAYTPLPYMRRLYYLNIDLYRYYIGRSDQSVTSENMINRYDQQIKVMREMLSAYTYDELKKMPRRLRGIMMHSLEVIMLNTYYFTTAKDSPERREKFYSMWRELKDRDKKLYKSIRRRFLVWILNHVGWKTKGRLTSFSYNFLCKHVKLGA